MSGSSLFSLGTSYTSEDSRRGDGDDFNGNDEYDMSDNPFATFFFAQATDYVGYDEGSRFFYRFPSSSGRVVDQIACGHFHCLAVTNVVDGSRLYSWGDRNSGGQLGRITANETDCATPGLVAFPGEEMGVAEESKYKVSSIACGAEFSMLVLVV